jgi:arylformamidase
MALYDISLTLSPSLVVWPGDPPVTITQPASMDRGDGFSITRLDIGAHVGTHVDAPAHFVRGGAGVDQLDLDVLIGPAIVVDGRGVEALTADVLESLAIPAGSQRVLFRTRNSELWRKGQHDFDEDFVAVAADGASWLVEHGVRLVGIDYLSVAPFADSAPTHQILLAAGVIAVENLNLSEVEPGEYQLVCLPLKIAGADGAPARAVLIG